MGFKPSTLICTVGTSLFYSNLAKLDPEKQYQKLDKDPVFPAEKEVLQKSGLLDEPRKLKDILEKIKQMYEKRNTAQITKQLLLLPSALRLCGAEINSIKAMIDKGFISPHREQLILLTSDTEDGKAIGDILSTYFQDNSCEIRFRRCEYLVVEGLQDEKPLIFRREGLPNLVRLLGEQYRKWGGESAIAINATGGYKAQIAFAVAFGQATRCPVYYKHERFDQIIGFPKIPFTIDLSPVENHLKLWAELSEPGNSLNQSELQSYLNGESVQNSVIYPLLDFIKDDGETLFSLSALGHVYWEAFLIQYPDTTLAPSAVQNRNGCHFTPDHHYPKGFKEYVRKLYEAFPELISRCDSRDYSGQRGITGNQFYLREGRIIGEYVDKDNFGGRFEVQTPASNDLERKWVIEQLNSWKT